jgi:hypothetical protein
MRKYSEWRVTENTMDTYLKLLVYTLRDCRKQMVIISLRHIIIEERSKVLCARDIVGSNDARVRPIVARSNVADIAKCLGRESL